MGKKRITRSLNAAEAAKLVSYDPDTGVFRRTTDGGGKRAGDVAGGLKDGYITISLSMTQYRAHHIAWLIMTGGWPPRDMDVEHIDRNRSNNAWRNLRLASRSQNNMNMSLRRDNKSGYRGVGQRKDTGRWYARIRVENRLHLLGHFDSFDEALSVRLRAEKVHFGEFAAK